VPNEYHPENLIRGKEKRDEEAVHPLNKIFFGYERDWVAENPT